MVQAAGLSIPGRAFAVQVANSVYVIQAESSPSMQCLTNISAQSATSTAKARPSQRVAPGAANFNNECLFVGGGADANGRGGVVLSTVDMYRPANDTWSAAPKLNQARYGVSFCAAGANLYALFGLTD